MPGIYTHNVIFKRVLDTVSRKSSSSYLSKSIVSLFNSPEHMRAGLFGSIGPNLFDYMKIRYVGRNYGSDISFALHGSTGSVFADNMIDIIKNYKDSRNEWASTQRAFLMGYVSHIIADSHIHPYVFYSSGFPSVWTRKEIINTRKLNLLFQYNIDNYFLYRDEGEENPGIDEMLPVYTKGRRSLIVPSVKVLLLQALKDSDEALFRQNFRKISEKEIAGSINYVPGLDRIPSNIRLCYRIKKTENQKLKSFMDRINDYPFLYSDFFVRYPGYKRVDMDALNLHQGKWQYPAGQKGLRYESVIQLIKNAVDKTVDAWEHIETLSFGGNDPDIKSYIDMDAFTGEKDAGFRDMKIKDPVKLRI